jgi:hypothetical protein
MSAPGGSSYAARVNEDPAYQPIGPTQMADSGGSAGSNRLAAPIRPGTRRRLGGQIVLFDQWVGAGRLVDKRE